MMESPTVSVIVPIYNVSEYLVQCLDSIIGQSFHDMEIICVDDGSTDDSLSIVRNYANKDDRFTILTQQRLGPSVARNKALDHATGKYVIFVDSDDYICEDAVKTLTDNINDSDIVVSGVNVFGGTDFKRNIMDRTYFKVPNCKVMLTDEIRLNTYVSAWGKMYRRETIEKNRIRFPSGLYYEDYSFHWQYLSVCSDVTFVKKRLYNYRRRSDSIMGATFGKGEISLDHIYVFDSLMTFFHRERISMDMDTVNMIFTQCFTSAYESIDEANKKQLIYESRAVINKYGLSGNDVTDILSSEDGPDATVRRIDNLSNITRYLEISELKSMICEYGLSRTVKKFIWTLLGKVLR